MTVRGCWVLNKCSGHDHVRTLSGRVLEGYVQG